MAPMDDPVWAMDAFSRSPKLARLGIGAGIGATYGGPAVDGDDKPAERSDDLNS
jgi:hypothetical protein